MEASEMELPKTLDDIMTILESKVSLGKLLKGEFDASRRSPSDKHILQYSIPGMTIGRSLDKVLIMMAGQSGTGKSTTINRLFEDEKLCTTSEFKSETCDIHQCIKKLTVTNVSPSIKSSLTFIDVPGSMDTDSKREALNHAKILNFRNKSQDLKSPAIPIKLMPFNLRGKVYPNLVLFVFNSTEKRLEGPDSALRKSLKMLADSDIVDRKDNNLLVVGTHAASLSMKKAQFKKKTAIATATLEEAVYDILGISKVKVVFVENEPEDSALEKDADSDFYSLPDGTLSHFNLINEMFHIFRATGDKLGSLLTSWYFHSECPDRSVKPIHQVYEVNEDDIAPEKSEAAQQVQNNLNMVSDDAIVPIFNFHSLGYAYCPVTESRKNHYVLKNDKSVTLLVGQNTKFILPDFVKYFKEKSTEFRQLSFENQEAYEHSKRSQYGLDLDSVLKVGVSSSGRWVKGTQSSGSESEVSVVSEVCFASLRVDNPEEFVTPDIVKALQELPSSYTDSPERFNEFFSKFGSHFVNTVYVGGAIRIDCKVQTASYNKEMESKIATKVGGIFKCISAGVNYSSETTCNELKSIGLNDARITITGGTPPMVTSLHDLTPEVFKAWMTTLESDPTELENNFTLYPYYNLSHCKHPTALRDATMEYLQQELRSLISKRRDDLAKKAQEEATTPDEGSKCFPASTMVRMASGGSKRISELVSTDILTTIQWSRNPEDVLKKSTPFCTFLHKKADVKAEFLCLKFSNGKTLKVTRGHLLLVYQDSNKVRSILAGSIKIGDAMVYLDEAGESSCPKVIEISVEYHVGVYSPLTSNGTFLADGFLVTSYADIGSFAVANCAMAPLRSWHGVKKSLSFRKTSDAVNEQFSSSQVVQGQSDGIHEYARFLMFMRKLVSK